MNYHLNNSFIIEGMCLVFPQYNDCVLFVTAKSRQSWRFAGRSESMQQWQ